MHDLKACIICLRSDVKVIHMSLGKLRSEYNLISGLQTHSGDGLPEYLCFECKSYIRRMKIFREKCHRSHYVLQEILYKNKQITQEILKNLNLRTINVVPTLSYLNQKHSRNSYNKIEFNCEIENHVHMEPLDIHVLQYNTFDKEVTYEVPAEKLKPILEVSHKDINYIIDKEKVIEDITIEETIVNDDVDRSDENDKVPAAKSQPVHDVSHEVVNFILHHKEEVIQDIAVEETIVDNDVDRSDGNDKVSAAKSEPVFDVSHEDINYIIDHKEEAVEGIPVEETIVDDDVDRNDENDKVSPAKSKPVFHVSNKDINYITDYKEETIEDIPVEETIVVDRHYRNDNDGYVNDETVCKDNVKTMRDVDADRSNFDEEYAVMVPLSTDESKAVIDIYKNYVQNGQLSCKVCGMRYHSANRMENHMRMHDVHKRGHYFCELCHFYYKTKSLLKTHVTEKHMYKYICRKCPEVNFDRISAKKHYIWSHLRKGTKKDSNWYESRPKWLKKKCPNGQKIVHCMRPVKKIIKIPRDYLQYTPISHKEQYALVLKRKNTKNYIVSPFKCELCYKGFREITTYNKHMEKHDPKISGPIQCDACKIHCKDTRKMYTHMIQSHLFKYTCQICSFTCTYRNKAKMHYMWHNNVTYSCPYCEKVYKKESTRLTHIRLKHPSTFICNLCGHSFVSENGLYCHKRMSHSTQELEEDGAKAVGESAGNHSLYCADCDVQFRDNAAYATHLGSSSKHAERNLSSTKSKSGARTERARRPRRHYRKVYNQGIVSVAHNCEICDKLLVNDQAARRHYDTEHPGINFPERYMCDICGHTTRQRSNLIVHMRKHTREKPFSCPHCERRFSVLDNRNRHLVVHTGEKRYECQHCNQRFSQNSSVERHIRKVHLKIPYASSDKNNRKRRKEADSISAGPTLKLAEAVQTA